jgi:hypothetical protein
VLLCFDGSADAAHAIHEAGAVLGGGRAVVLSVSEPLPACAAYDPATLLTAPLSKLAAKALELDEVGREVAEETAEQGVALALTAGFTAEARTERGKRAGDL